MSTTTRESPFRSSALVIVTAASLAACGSLPRIVPDMARQASPPRIETGKGPLSAERSRQIIDTLRKPAGDSSALDRHIALEAALVDIQHFVIVDRVRLDPAGV